MTKDGKALELCLNFQKKNVKLQYFKILNYTFLIPSLNRKQIILASLLSNYFATIHHILQALSQTLHSAMPFRSLSLN